MPKHIRKGKPQRTMAFVEVLARARRESGLTQQALGAQLGLPQSHISRIEGGKTDLRLSSLIELARQLDLEVVLVPRKYVPAIRAMTASTRDESPQDDDAGRYLYRLGGSDADASAPGEV